MNRDAIEREFVSMLEEVGALKSGHFLLASGRHSDRYVEKFNLLRQPSATSRACELLVQLLDRPDAIDLVVGPTTGGIILAFEVGRQLGIPTAYAERATEGSAIRAFKRGTVIDDSARVLVVDDILTTGGSVSETLAALGAWNADVREIAVLVDRSGGRTAFDVPLRAVATLDIASWLSEECPLCTAGTPLAKPGSTARGA